MCRFVFYCTLWSAFVLAEKVSAMKLVSKGNLGYQFKRNLRTSIQVENLRTSIQVENLRTSIQGRNLEDTHLKKENDKVEYLTIFTNRTLHCRIYLC